MLIDATPTHYSRLFSLLCASGLLILCACSTKTGALPSTDPLPPAFSQTGDDVVLPQQWWLSLDDPALNRVMTEALSQNPDLKATLQRLRQAEAIARRSESSLWPELTKNHGVQREYISNDAGSTQINSFSAGLNLAYEVDLWNRAGSERDADRLAAEASREDLQAAALSLTAQLASTWYQLQEQYQQRVLVEQQLRTNELLLELIDLFVRTGRTGIADRLQQAQLVESNRGERALIQSQINQLQNRLAILCGDLPMGGTYDWISLKSPGLLPTTGLPSDLIRRRPDLRSAFLAIQSEDRQLAATIARQYPTFSLSVSVSKSAETISGLLDNWLSTLAANIAGPLLDAGRRRADVERQKAVVMERFYAYRVQTLQALAEVEDALAAETQQRQFLTSLDAQLTLAQQVNETLTDRYTRGNVGYQRVLDGLISQQSLERTRLTALKDLILFRIDLCRALAGGIPIDKQREHS